MSCITKINKVISKKIITNRFEGLFDIKIFHFYGKSEYLHKNNVYLKNI